MIQVLNSYHSFDAILLFFLITCLLQISNSHSVQSDPDCQLPAALIDEANHTMGSNNKYVIHIVVDTQEFCLFPFTYLFSEATNIMNDIKMSFSSFVLKILHFQALLFIRCQ